VGKGRHTTTHRELILLPGGGLVIDTPGMRELQVWGDGEGVKKTFDDVMEIARSCRFRDCTHNTEPGCAVREALDNGSLDPARYTNYLKLQREFRFLARREDHRARLAEKNRWKRIVREVRQKQKRRGKEW
jgi:ribosome biogenesis GTPase